MKEKNLIKTIVVVLFYLCWSIFSKVPISLFNLKLTNNLIALYDFISAFLLLVIIFFMYKDALIKEFKKTNKNGIKLILISIIVIFFIIGLSNLLLNVIFKNKIISNINNSGLSIIDGKNLLMILRLLIISPVIEELTFRKSIRTVVNNNVFFVLFSGIFLGALYFVSQSPTLMGLISSIPYFLVWIYLSILYTKTNNIFINVFSRIFYNILMLGLVI